MSLEKYWVKKILELKDRRKQKPSSKLSKTNETNIDS